MGDVGGVRRDKEGPSGPKKKKEPSSEEFRELMKVGKTREVDPEEKKKRKRQEETDAETTADQTQGAQQGAASESSEPSPYKVSSSEDQPMMGSSPPSSTPTDSGTVSSAPPPSSEEPLPPPPMVDSYAEEAPTAAPPTTTSIPTVTPGLSQPADTSQSSDYYQTDEPQKVSSTSETQTDTQSGDQSDTSSETTTTDQTEGTIEKEAGMEGLAGFGGGGAIAAGPTSTDESVKHALEKMTGGQALEQEKAKKAGDVEVPLAPNDLPRGGWEASKGTKEEEKPEEKIHEVGHAKEAEAHVDLQMAASPAPEVSEPSGVRGSAFANLPPHVMALFERMVGVMTVMQHAGVTETTINLSNPQFANSPFYGSEIVIREFSTAPKEFNIEFLGDQQATDMFSGHTQEILAGFQSGSYNFKVNRIDANYLSETKEAREKRAKRVGRKQAGGGA